MKTTEINKVLDFLTKVKNIMDVKANFTELDKKTQVEICELFEHYFIYEEDNDHEGCYYMVHFETIGIVIQSYAKYDQDFNLNSCDLWMYAGAYDERIRNINNMISIVAAIKPTDDVIGLLNTSIITADGSYDLKTITLSEAMAILDGAVLDSAIGHAATAEIMSELLDVSVELNRQQFSQKVGQRALVFKLNGRAPEGVILDRAEVEKIGYDFKLLTRLS